MANDEIDDKEVCLVFSKDDSFTSFVQALLAFFALMSLYLKRQLERPRRSLRTWFLDVSKQGIGACYLHLLNLITATVLADLVSTKLDDQCAWYAINFTIDSTFGLILSIFFVRLLDYVANKNGWVELKDSGVYHGEDAIRHYFFQLTAWLINLSFVRAIEFYVMWLTSNFLARIGQWLFQPFHGHIRVELLFVMIFFPGILNVAYFWIVDSTLMANTKSHLTHEFEGNQYVVISDSLSLQQHESESPTPVAPLTYKTFHETNRLVDRTLQNTNDIEEEKKVDYPESGV